MQWLLSLQMSTGAFPGGLYGGSHTEPQPSVFNTGQILQGLVRAHIETNRPEILQAAVAAPRRQRDEQLYLRRLRHPV